MESDVYFQKVLNLDNSNIYALVGLGKNSISQNDLKKAEAYLKEAIFNEPNNIETIILIIGINTIKGDYQTIYPYIKKLTELKPNDSRFWIFLGLVQNKLGQIEEAKNSYLKATSLDETNWTAIFNLGKALILIGEYQQANIYFNNLINLKPDVSIVWCLLGHVQKRLNDLVKAKTSFLKAIELDKENLDAHLNLAFILVEEKSFIKAQIHIEKVINKKPGNSGILNSIGEIYRISKNFEKALPFYLDAIESDLKNHYPYFGLISCMIGLNQTQNALEQLKKALEVAIKNKFINEIIEDLEKNFVTVFIHTSLQIIENFLNEFFVIVEEYHYTDQLYKSIPNAIFELLIQHQRVETERFEFIEKYLNDKFKEIEAMVIPLKFLNIGIRHLKKNEKNVLFQLTKEERNTFIRFVLNKLKIGPGPILPSTGQQPGIRSNGWKSLTRRW